MSFKKYNKIVNHYQKKEIENYYEDFPSLKFCEWIAQEKIDGANISLLFSPEFESPKVFSRNKELKEGERFYGIFEFLKGKDIENFINKFQKKSKNENKIYRFWGEFFGRGIQKRIDYGDKKFIVFFDMEIDDIRLTPEQADKFFIDNDIKDWFIPIVKIGKFEDLLNIDIENKKSLFAKKQGIESPIEGVVLKPYKGVFYYKNQELISIKYKSKKFVEKMERKSKKNKKEIKPDIKNLNEKFASYLNENRVLSVFSKEGEIKSFKEISKYIKLVLDDMKKDFMTELTDEEKKIFNGLDKKEIKIVFNIGSSIASILKKYL